MLEALASLCSGLPELGHSSVAFVTWATGVVPTERFGKKKTEIAADSEKTIIRGEGYMMRFLCFHIHHIPPSDVVFPIFCATCIDPERERQN